MKRESNIELLRITAMILVVLVHCNYFSLGPVTPEAIAAAPLDSFVKAFAQQVCIICVNVFILISGWFGIRPSLKGVASFIFQILFYNIMIICAFNCFGSPVSPKLIIATIHNYWFVPPYLILYSVSPVLNSFMENASRKQYLAVVALFFTWEFIFGWVTDVNSTSFKDGYSAISFIGLYLLAGFLRKHCPWRQKIKIKTSFAIYLLFTLIPVCLYIITQKEWRVTSYCSPFVITATTFFFLAFERMKVRSAFINSLGVSAFAIYLIHMHPAVYKYYQSAMREAYELLGGGLYMMACIIFAFCYGMACIALDKLRILVWKPINEKIKALEEKYRLNL